MAQSPCPCPECGRGDDILMGYIEPGDRIGNDVMPQIPETLAEWMCRECGARWVTKAVS